MKETGTKMEEDSYEKENTHGNIGGDDSSIPWRLWRRFQGRKEGRRTGWQLLYREIRLTRRHQAISH